MQNPGRGVAQPRRARSIGSWAAQAQAESLKPAPQQPWRSGTDYHCAPGYGRSSFIHRKKTGQRMARASCGGYRLGEAAGKAWTARVERHDIQEDDLGCRVARRRRNPRGRQFRPPAAEERSAGGRRPARSRTGDRVSRAHRARGRPDPRFGARDSRPAFDRRRAEGSRRGLGPRGAGGGDPERPRAARRHSAACRVGGGGQADPARPGEGRRQGGRHGGPERRERADRFGARHRGKGAAPLRVPGRARHLSGCGSRLAAPGRREHAAATGVRAGPPEEPDGGPPGGRRRGAGGGR